MAATSESEVEEDMFLGFDEEEKQSVAAWRQERFEARNQSDSESHISGSSVSTEDLSDFEEEEDEEETWNETQTLLRSPHSLRLLAQLLELQKMELQSISFI